MHFSGMHTACLVAITRCQGQGVSLEGDPLAPSRRKELGEQTNSCKNITLP